MKFCDKLAKARKANNLSQEQLADELGVTRQSISKWESGDSYPDMAKIVQLCKVLNCTIDDILDDEIVSNTKQEKTTDTKDSNKANTLQKYFDEFLGFVTKTVNMISHMGTKQTLKMIIELFILGIVLYSASTFILWGLENLLWNIFGFFPKAYEVLKIIITSIVGIGEAVLSVVIIAYVYKTRYLDYYVTLTDNNATTQSVEEPIEENKAANFNNNKKEKVVIIRDPKHSNSKVIDGLVNVIIFLCKMVVVIFAIPAAFAALVSAAGIITCIIRKGYIFKASILICISVLLFSALLLLIFYNLVFNRKQLHKLNIILIVLSLLSGGSGCGLLVNSVTKMNIQKENTPVETTSKKVILNDLADGDEISIETSKIEYVIDDSINEIVIDFTYPVVASLNEDLHETDEHISYYYYISTNQFFEFNELLKDVERNTISNSYSLENYLKVKVTCSEANKAKFMNFD